MAHRGRRSLPQAAALALLAAACRTPREAGPAPLASTTSPSAPSVTAPQPSIVGEPRLPPPPPELDVTSNFVTLAVAGFRDAVVSVPKRKNRAASVMVALHGNFDRPEWQCETWRRMSDAETWIVCPRGIPRRDAPPSLDRWEWGSLASTKTEISASLAALRARFPEHVDGRSRLVLIGFSLGAILGARMLADPELAIESAVLIEGGYEGWTKAAAERAADAGLGGVLFACGQTACRNAVRRVSPLLERAGIVPVVVEDLKAGHDYSGSLADQVRARFWQFRRDSAERAASRAPAR
jgi:predicted esterase